MRRTLPSSFSSNTAELSSTFAIRSAVARHQTSVEAVALAAIERIRERGLCRFTFNLSLLNFSLATVGTELKWIRCVNLKVSRPNTPISHSFRRKLMNQSGHFRIGILAAVADQKSAHAMFVEW